MYRKTYALVNGDILENNTLEIINKYNKYKYYIGVVKNNAYHHGIKVVNNLIKGGINYLAVSSLDEAIDIRKYNSSIPILILSPISLDFIDDAISHKVTITVDNLEYLKLLNQIKLPYKLNIHLKIDTGMNRLGFKNKKDITNAVKLINDNKMLVLEGIYSHFATTGINDYYYDQQLSTFNELTSNIDLDKIPIIHFDRSLTMVTHEKIPFVSGVRLGIVLFGFSGSMTPQKGLKNKLKALKNALYKRKHHISPTILENDLNLQTAFKLYSEVISLRKVTKGEVVGYNALFKANVDAYIATIPIGYADGVTKEFKNVFINNQKYPIVADTMDMIMVLVDKSVKYKDKVEIFGDNISIKEVTNNLGINAYHLFNQISNRVPRIHLEKNDKIEIKY